MYIKWSVTDDLSDMTLEYFEKEYNGIYGFFSLEIDGNKLGERAEECYEDEGLYDIAYYLGCLIKCGIAMKKRENIPVMLLERVLAELVLEFDDDVTISFVNIGSREIYWSAKITREELTEEIEYNYHSFIDYIKKVNPLLLDSYLLGILKSRYDDFKSLK